MLSEINAQNGTNFQYLAELDAIAIPGSGWVVAKYISKYSSESVRAYLLTQLVSDKVPNCDRIILQSYLQFKSSGDYIPPPETRSSAHIYVRYDNAFKKLRPKQLTEDLLTIIRNPRDAFYLPFTLKMLASWKIPELQDLLVSYSSNSNISCQDVGIDSRYAERVLPPFDFIKRELRFSAINALQHYPSEAAEKALRICCDDIDADIRLAAQKALKKLQLLDKKR